ncbi:sensor histidine kinase [Sphingomonas sp. Leaf4]|uniref:sensor histidine kinase n=1 Tax=Sphingomonas sp. Leaf4 TaxID=2876553 RepID=UPI001E48C0EA|nr:sensor histidine kinase [Sphingomonas sp. Leaf4]
MTPPPSPRDGRSMVVTSRRSWIEGPLPWLAYLPFYAMPWFWKPPGDTGLILSIAGIALFLPVYLLGYSAGQRARTIAAAIIVAIGLVLAPFGGSWTVFPIYAAAMVGYLQPPRRAIVAILTIAILTSGVGIALGQMTLWWLPGVLLSMMTGFGTFSREAFYKRTQALLASQEEVRRLAGTAERERMARDLHDVIGRTLTLIALRADLAAKLVTPDVAAAQAEMRAVADIARTGLSDVRAALSGTAGGSLGHELDLSRDALKAAGIVATVTGDPHAIPPNAGAVLAMTVREAVTNVIRHAGAGACRIDLTTDDTIAGIRIVDDGRGGAFREGHGLTGMRQRLAAAGGTLEVAWVGPGTCVAARVPVGAA